MKTDISLDAAYAAFNCAFEAFKVVVAERDEARAQIIKLNTSAGGLLGAANERIAELEAEVERAYARGEDSSYGDWVGALGDYCEALTPSLGWSPSSTAGLLRDMGARVEELQAEVERLRAAINHACEMWFDDDAEWPMDEGGSVTFEPFFLALREAARADR